MPDMNYMADAEPPENQEEAPPESQATAELPKTVLGGQEAKPGDQITLEIVQVTENSVVVKSAGAETEKPPSEEAAPAEPQGGPGSMESMME
jgi:hypothetical protein